jgi:hypothetical protein
MMQEFWRLAIVGVLSLGMHTYGDWYETFLKQRFNLPDLGAIAVVVLTLVAIFFILDAILIRITHAPGVRFLCHPCSRWEGYWYQRVKQADRPHSISIIRHDFIRHSWRYEGHAYKADYKLGARWRSRDKEYWDETWLFRGQAEHLDESGDAGGGGRRHVFSVLYLDRVAPGLGKRQHLHGRVLDLDVTKEKPAEGFPIELYRIRKGHWKKAGIKKKDTLLTHDDAQKLIAAIGRPQP